jgi:hypothetical protein
MLVGISTNGSGEFRDSRLARRNPRQPKVVHLESRAELSNAEKQCKRF